jgi:hypothetical protein
MFRGVQVGAWYRISVEGRNVFGKALERRRKFCTFQYVKDDGEIVTGEVSRSDVRGRLGDHIVAPLESAIAAAQSPQAAPSTPEAAIAPGDWHRFEYEGDIVAGVVYRSEGDQYTLFVLHNGIPTFVTMPLASIGPQEERLTGLFRREIARNPNHLDEWVSQAGRFAERPGMTLEPALVQRKAGQRSSPAQKRLFPK